LAGRFARNGLLRFGVPLRGEIRLTRLDTGQSVELSHRLEVVPRPPALAELLRQATAQQASPASRRAFAAAWQSWVQAILIDHADDPALIDVVG
jgi:hypothetical protein